MSLLHRSVLILVLTLILAGCNSSSGSSSTSGPETAGDSEDASSETITLSGRVVNGPLSEAIVQVYDLDGQLIGTTQTTASGSYSLVVGGSGPFQIVASEGTLDNAPYLGELSGHCGVLDACHATPFTTAVVELMAQLGMDSEEARAELGNRLGFHADPFVEPDLESAGLDMVALRSSLDTGAGLSLWVTDLLAWVQDAEISIPAGILTPVDIPPYEPDLACTEFSVDIETPHYLVSSHAEMVTALTDPDDQADGRLVIGITADISEGFDSGADNWFYDSDHALVLVGWKEDGSRPVIDSGGSSRHLLYRSSEDLTVSGLVFENGRAGSGSPSGFPDRSDGGSIRSTDSRATIHIHDSHFNGNAAGSAVLILSFAGGAIGANGPVIINHSRFYDNLANRWGGAVHSKRRVSACFSEFESNHQTNTGAGHNTGGHGGSAISSWWNDGIEVYESSFIDNTTRGDFGGVLYSRMEMVLGTTTVAGEIKVANSTFSGNTSTNGAAVAMSNGVIKYLTDSGMSTYASGGDIYLYNSNIEFNETDTGSIVRADEANIYILNSHFEGNDADLPEGMIVAAEVAFKDSDFVDNAQPVMLAEMVDLGGNSFVGNRNPSLGPEGRIAYYHQGTIRAIDPNGQNDGALTTVDYFEPSPSWSPDGSDIAYVDGPFGATDVWRLSVGPGQKTRQTNNSDTSTEHTAWSAQNEIAYVRRNFSVSHTPFLIYVTTPGNGVGAQISGSSAAQDHERHPAWSPDGEELVFSNRVNVVDSGSNRLPVLFRMNRNGSSRAEFWDIPGIRASAWSPDGSQLAYQLNDEIWLRPLASGVVEKVADGRNPTWSPDSQWIAFDHEGVIFRLLLTDSNAEPLEVTVGTMPDWSGGAADPD